MLQVLKKYQRNQEIKARVQVLLCAKEHSSILRKYIKRMARLNQTILASYILQRSPIPALSSAAKATHKISIVVQYGIHISFLKNQLTSRYCSLSQRALWAKSQPYSNGPWLKRFTTGVAKLKEQKKWTVKYFPNFSQIRPSRYFYIKNSFEASSALTPDLRAAAKEVSLPSSLLSGHHSFLPSVSHY